MNQVFLVRIHLIKFHLLQDYDRIIKTPICFDDVQAKLSQTPSGYRHSREFIADCHLIFENALTYGDPEVSST